MEPTQQEFNQLVLQALKKTSLPMKDAIQWAVSQIKESGRSWFNLLHDAEVIFGDDPLSMFHKLYKNQFEQENVVKVELEYHLVKLENFLKKGIKYQLYAGRSNLDATLIRLVDWFSKPGTESDTLEKLLLCFLALCTGYTEMITPKYIKFLLGIFFLVEDKDSLSQIIARIILFGMDKEDNKEELFRSAHREPFLESLFHRFRFSQNCQIIGCDIINHLGQGKQPRAQKRAKALSENHLLPLYKELSTIENGVEHSRALLQVTMTLVNSDPDTLVKKLLLLDPTFNSIEAVLHRYESRILMILAEFLTLLCKYPECKAAMNPLIRDVFEVILYKSDTPKVLSAFFVVIAQLADDNANATTFRLLRTHEEIYYLMKNNKDQTLRENAVFAISSLIRQYEIVCQTSCHCLPT